MQQAVESFITLMSSVLAQFETSLHIGCYPTKASTKEIFLYVM